MLDNKKENFIKAVRYIHANMDQPLRIEEVAEAACVSVSTLKRLFIEAVNLTPGQFIRRIRMEFAFRSLTSRHDSILEVALGVGFDDQSAFARRFKETFGYSPRDARTRLNIVSELESMELDEPDIVEIESFQCQSVTEQGLYYECAPKAWSELKNIISADELDENFSGIFIGIGHDNPHEGSVAEDEVRFTAGVTFINPDSRLATTVIPAGRYARFHCKGKLNNLGIAYHYIYGKWSDGASVTIDQKQSAFMLFDRLPEGMGEYEIFIHVPLQG